MSELQELVDDRSPDLNIMEDLWSYLDRKAKAAKIKTLQGLKRKLTMEWQKLPWSYIRTSVQSMRTRLELNIILSSNNILITGSELAYS